MNDTAFGTFDELLAATHDSMKPIVRALRALIVDVDPAAVEVVRLGDRAATYGVGPRKMIDGYCYILPHAKWVNVGFFHGALLDDPADLLEGTGAKMRHVKIRSLQDVEAPALRALVETAHATRVREG